jgi:hypothetical protein
MFSRVHSCRGQIAIAEGSKEPPAPKCRCRKYIDLAKATEMVKNGDASWVIISRSQEAVQETCRLCSGDPEVKNCANCRGTGKETVIKTDSPRDDSNDIVLVSRVPADKRDKKRSSALAMKTPRVATIEEEHITLAYVLEVKEAAERIEEYGRLILDARMFVGKNRTPAIKIEPEGVWVRNRNTGKLEYEPDPNWGRMLFSNIPSAIKPGNRFKIGFRRMQGDADSKGEDRERGAHEYDV